MREYSKPIFLIVVGSPEPDGAVMPDRVQQYVQTQRVLGGINADTGTHRPLDLRPGSNYNMVPVTLADLCVGTAAAGVAGTERVSATADPASPGILEHALSNRRDIVFTPAGQAVPVQIFAEPSTSFSAHIRAYDVVVAYAVPRNISADGVAAYLAGRNGSAGTPNSEGVSGPGSLSTAEGVSAKEYADTLAQIVAVCSRLRETLRGTSTNLSAGSAGAGIGAGISVEVLVYFTNTDDKSPMWSICVADLDALGQIGHGKHAARGGMTTPVVLTPNTAKRSAKKPVAKRSAKKSVAKRSAKKPVAKRSAKKSVAKRSAKKPAAKRSAKKPVAKRSAKRPSKK